MTIQLILLIILGILLFFIFFKITKMVLKAIMFAFLILLLLIGLSGFLIFKDIKDFKENIGQKPILFVLTDQDKLLTAISMDDLGDSEEDEDDFFDGISLKTMPQSKVNQLSSYYQNKDYKSMLGNNYKVLFIDLKFIENGLSDEQFEDDKRGLTKQKTLNILTARDPLTTYKRLATDDDIDEDNPEAIRNIFFIMSFITVIQEKSPLYLLKGLKNSQIKVYKEPFSIKLIKGIPKK